MTKRRKKQRATHRPAKKGRDRDESLGSGDLMTASVWLERAQTSIHHALLCRNRMMDSGAPLADRDLCWALAKYVENTEESVKQLDNITHRLLLAELIEIPLSGPDANLTWKNLKGMRERLAHRFWEIDNRVVLDAVMHDFPLLDALFDSLHIVPEPFNIRTDQTADFIVSTEWIRKIRYARGPEDPLLPGNSFIAAAYDRDFGWNMFRVGLNEERNANTISVSDGWSERSGIDFGLKLYGR